jgi:FAD binding domain/Berberine and berberine like
MSPVAEPETIAQLRADLNGRVITPDDRQYDPARVVFPGGIDPQPAAIVRPGTAEEVAHVVSLVRDAGLELAVRSGGHSGAGHGSTDGGVVLDLREMRALEIDPAARIAVAETGLTAGAYTDGAGAYNLATGFGDNGAVGIGGITLGGGVGLLSRAHGMTIDDLLGAEMVTADGKLLAADEDNHPDLFWAIRGGGGNFGVATRFRFRLHEVESVVGGDLLLPATPAALWGLLDLCAAAPDELSVIVNVMPAPPLPSIPAEHHGEVIIRATVCYAGPAAEGERAIAPLRSLAGPIADGVRQVPYPEIYEPLPEGYHPTVAFRNALLDDFDRDAAEVVIESLRSSDAPMRVAQFRVLGGAVARVPAEATAFAHRDAPIMVNVAAFYESPDDQPLRQAWVDGLVSALSPRDGAYVNFLVDEGPERVRAAYPGETWERLSAVKARYDPDNLFHRNQNIPPA